LISPGKTAKVVHPDAPGGAAIANRPEDNFAQCEFEWEGPSSGRVEVVIHDLRLLVDSRDFGQVKAGDHVIVNATTLERRVSVNGSGRIALNEE
jgi:hypothetical protein